MEVGTYPYCVDESEVPDLEAMHGGGSGAPGEMRVKCLVDMSLKRGPLLSRSGESKAALHDRP